ncbi:hypothetical protein E1H13_26075, partial [Nodosilinea sp. P-1105]|nr:hypothetical protein [Nodosilinea sp. P-1105]
GEWGSGGMGSGGWGDGGMGGWAGFLRLTAEPWRFSGCGRSPLTYRRFGKSSAILTGLRRYK